MSGDQVLIEQDGREVSFSIAKLSDSSARQARKLAGVEEPRQAVPMEMPLRMEFKQVISSQHQSAGLARDARKLPAPPFKMGSPADEPGREDSEPEHTVRFKRDFMLKATEVTWSEWNSVRKFAEGYGYTDIALGTNGQAGGEGDQHPVVGITWLDALKWCNLLSQIENRQTVYYTHPKFDKTSILMTGAQAVFPDWNANGYRLPTEAEWEFACRPETSRRAFHTGPIRETEVEPVDHNLDKAGWFAGNSAGRSHPVAGKEPNRLGLFDMHGNAAEWCWDLAGPLGTAEVCDPTGAILGEMRIIRGGSWSDPAKYCRAASRGSRNPNFTPNQSVGFRPARGTR
jgi:formylglycine-generating enzyme required for sulfatase activity